MPKVKFCTIGLYDKEDNLLSMNFGAFFNELEQRMFATNNVRNIVKEVDGRTLRIMQFHRKNGYSENEFLIPIGKVKSGATYKMAEDKYNVEQIDYDIFDINIVYYNSVENVLMVTVDKNGPSIALIAKYFQQFLSEDVQVRIEPIYRVSGLERVKKSDFVSSVVISLNLTSQEQRFYNDSTEEKGNFTQCTQQIANLTRDDFGSNFMTLSFGLGKRSKKSMTKDAVLDLIYKLRLDSDMIREITVKCKKDSEEKIEVAKLKESQFDLSLDISADGIDYILAHADDFFDARRIDYNKRVNELRAICRKEEVIEYFKENRFAFA